jgi:hypothetical protein
LDFSSYWKEIAIVLAALFAVAGTIFDVQDKASHRITIWGRIFFGLTLLSVIGGFYAQWEENAREASRTKQSQDDMLKVIENTNRNVYDVARLLQPLGKSTIFLFFNPNCAEVKEFCDAAMMEGKGLITTPKEDPRATPTYSVGLTNAWLKWPDRSGSADISLLFFKDPKLAQTFLNDRFCSDCDKPGDISFNVSFDISERYFEEQTSKPASVHLYEADNKGLTIMDMGKDIIPKINNDKILSTLDLPGSILLVSNPIGLLKKLVLTSITIQTDHGQTINIDNPTMIDVKNDTLFEYVFPASTQH